MQPQNPDGSGWVNPLGLQRWAYVEGIRSPPSNTTSSTTTTSTTVRCDLLMVFKMPYCRSIREFPTWHTRHRFGDHIKGKDTVLAPD